MVVGATTLVEAAVMEEEEVIVCERSSRHFSVLTSVKAVEEAAMEDVKVVEEDMEEAAVVVVCYAIYACARLYPAY